MFEENVQNRRAPPLVRVEKMFENVQSKLPGAPKFLLCLLPERKNCDVYGNIFFFSFTFLLLDSKCCAIIVFLTYRTLEEEVSS